MKAVVKHAPGNGNVDVLEVEEPSCNDNQVKVEIGFCGVCGTDIHVLHDTFRNYPPVILGIDDPASPCIGTVSFHPELYGPELIAFALRVLRGKSSTPTHYIGHGFLGKDYLVRRAKAG